MKLDLYAERLIYRKKEWLYAERNDYFPYWSNLKKIVLIASICIFSSYFLFVDVLLIKMRTQTHFQASWCKPKVGAQVNYRGVGRSSYKMNIRPLFPPVIRP